MRYLSWRTDLGEMQTDDRVYARETSVDIWSSGLADCAKKLLHAWMYEMRGLEHGVELLPGLSPLISGLVYLNRSLDSSQTANPSEDEEARESEVLKSLRIHVQLAKDNGGLSLSLSFR